MSDKSFSLFQLNQHLRRVLAFNLRQPVWVRAELAQVSLHKGGAYLVLVEKNEFGTQAQADAVIWSNTYEKLKTELGESVLEGLLQKGRSLLLQVGVEYHEYHGLRYTVRGINTAYTIGQLETQKQKDWAHIQKMGWERQNTSLYLAPFARRIAVISSAQAAGYQDFIQQLNQNTQGYAFETCLFEAAMQGANLEKEVCTQLGLIAKVHAQRFDMIVIVRGGGARLDLAGFDLLPVCEAIAACSLPVLLGIGHETDQSLADRVAFRSLKTPTAVADFIVERVANFEQDLTYIRDRARRLFETRLQTAQAKLDQLAQQFKYTHPDYTLQRGFAILFDEKGNRISRIAQAEKSEKMLIQLADGAVWVVKE